MCLNPGPALHSGAFLTIPSCLPRGRERHPAQLHRRSPRLPPHLPQRAARPSDAGQGCPAEPPLGRPLNRSSWQGLPPAWPLAPDTGTSWALTAKNLTLGLSFPKSPCWSLYGTQVSSLGRSLYLPPLHSLASCWLQGRVPGVWISGLLTSLSCPCEPHTC